MYCILSVSQFLPNEICSDGRIFNCFTSDQAKEVDEHPNKRIDITENPGKAYFSRDMMIRGPLSQL